MNSKSILIRLTLCIIISGLCISGAYAMKLKNLTSRSVLVRLNSGNQVKIEPKGTREVPDSEAMGNSMIEKMVNERILKVIPSTSGRKK